MSDKKKCKERYDWYKANGICVDCGRREAWNGARCIDCAGKRRERARVRYNALKDNPEFRADHCEREHRRYEAKKAAGICPKCGSRRAEDGMVFCGICKVKHRRNMNKHNHKSKRTRAEQYDGVSCAWCKAPVVEGRYFCADCLDKKRKNTEKARAAVDWARHPFRGGAT